MSQSIEEHEEVLPSSPSIPTEPSVSSVKPDGKIRLSDTPPPEPPPTPVEGKAWNAQHDLGTVKIVENSDEIVARIRERLEKSPTAKSFLEKLDSHGGRIVIADLGKPSAESTLFGAFNPETGVLRINSHLSEDMMILTAAHELTHAVPQSADSSYLNRNVEEMNDFTPAAAAGWLFGAEAAAETTSILIAYEMKQAGDEKPYDVALNYNEHLENIMGLTTGFWGLEYLQEEIGIHLIDFDKPQDTRDEAMAKAFDQNIDQGLDKALASAFDTWLTHPSGIGSYITQANSIYSKSIDHVGYHKEFQTYVMSDHPSDDVGVRTLSAEELSTIMTIGSYDISQHVTINPNNGDQILERIEAVSSYHTGKFREMTANIETYNETGAPPSGRNAYRLEDLTEYHNSDFKDQVEFFEYLEAKQNDTLDYISGYVDFRINEPSTSENIFFDRYVELTKRGVLPLPDMPEDVEDFAREYGQGIRDINIKLAYSGAINSGDHNLVRATEAVFKSISEHFEPDDPTGTLITNLQSANIDDFLNGPTLRYDLVYDIDDYSPNIQDTLNDLFDAHLMHHGVFNQNVTIPDHILSTINNFDNPLLSRAYKALATHGIPEDIAALEQTLQNLEELKDNGTSEYAVKTSVEVIAMNILKEYGSSEGLGWDSNSNINWQANKYPELKHAVNPLDGVVELYTSDSQPIEEANLELKTSPIKIN